MQGPQATSEPEPRGDDAPVARLEVAGQDLTLFEDSPSLIAAMLADIQTATRRVWMESYIFAGDAAGQAVAAALAERARAGLDVRLMVDAWGSFSTTSSLFKKLRAAGVKVHIFHALGEAVFHHLRFLQVLNQRNHRKILVIDERIAYFGGMNIVDQSGIHSTDDAKRRRLPTSAGWRDVHMRLAGSQQAEVARIFERLWNQVHRKRSTRQPKWSVQHVLKATGDAFYFFDSRPLFKSRRPHRVLVPLIRQARDEITLAVAYFVPVGSILRELLKARRRGVRVTIIVPGMSDVKLVQWATRHMCGYLLKHGFRIYERKDRMLHSKVTVVDGMWTVIGSCNLDARSLLLNLEFFALIRSPKLAKAVSQICADEIRDSVRIRADHCRHRPWWQRLLHRAAWSMRRWL